MAKIKLILKVILRKLSQLIHILRYCRFFPNIYIGQRSKVVNAKFIHFGKNVNIQPDTLVILHNKKETLSIGNGCDIGRFSRIAAMHRIILEDNVFTGPNVFICDYNHSYENIDIPIKAAGEKVSTEGVSIGRDSWIGTNSVIVGNVSIGKHCVIGANSVVTKNIPDYCVAVGAPAKVIKKYNFHKKSWEIVDK